MWDYPFDFHSFWQFFHYYPYLSAHIACLIPLAICKSGEDYYCMYYDAIPTVVDVITPLAPESLKSCTVKTPKIKDIIDEVDENVEDEFTFDIIVEIGAFRERQIEYFIYDTLSMVGTVGGTLGLFVGFSFYDFIGMIIDLFSDKLSPNKQNPGHSSDLVSVITNKG